MFYVTAVNRSCEFVTCPMSSTKLLYTAFLEFSDNVTGAICPVGHYCPQGSSIYIICPAGNYTNETGQAECKVCPAGFQCTGGDYLEPCPQGRYCPEGTGLTTQPCPIGNV